MATDLVAATAAMKRPTEGRNAKVEDRVLRPPPPWVANDPGLAEYWSDLIGDKDFSTPSDHGYLMRLCAIRQQESGGELSEGELSRLHRTWRVVYSAFLRNGVRVKHR